MVSFKSLAIAAVATIVATSSTFALEEGDYYRPSSREASGVYGTTATYRRSPCPALNTLANHGYLPRNGQNITHDKLSTALQNVYNIGPGVVAILISQLPDPISLDYLGIHNNVEHDASLAHTDAYYGHDPMLANETLAEDLFKRAGSDGLLTNKIVAKTRKDRGKTCNAENPKSGPAHASAPGYPGHEPGSSGCLPGVYVPGLNPMDQPQQGDAMEEYARLMGIKVENDDPNVNANAFGVPGPNNDMAKIQANAAYFENLINRDRDGMDDGNNVTSMTLPAGIGGGMNGFMSAPMPPRRPYSASAFHKGPQVRPGMLPPDMVGSQTLPPEIISAMIKNNPTHNFENLSEDEKQALIKEEKSRERNRDHSRKSRLRKKEFVESLKHEVGQLQVYQQICEQCMDCIALVAAEASAVFLFSSAAYTRVLGYQNHQIVPGQTSFLDMVHPVSRIWCSYDCVITSVANPVWKIYRRYRHFQKYISQSSELLASRSVRVPRLSQAYLKIFHAQHCKDRLVELHKWLEGVLENTQNYCQILQQKQEEQQKEKLHELQQQRLKQLEEQAKLKTTWKNKNHSNSDVPVTSINSGRVRAPSRMSTTTASTRRSSISLKTIEQLGDPALYVLRTDKAEALPVVMLSCFLFAGANCPFPHVFGGMPSFALALEELNVQLEQAAPAAYPSKLRNSMTSRAGLGLRLTPSHEQEGQFLGAVVAGFLRDQQELDPALVDVPVGAKLVRVNGIDVSDSPFDQVLSTFGAAFVTVIKRLRSASRPTSLCFRWYQDFSPFLETDLAEQHSSSLTKPHAIGAKMFASSLDCVAEAQTDLSNSLQLALMENASVRDEISVLQDAHRELRLAQERAAERERILQAKVEQSDVEIAKLKEEVDIQRQELEKARLRAAEAEAKLATTEKKQLIKESNRSIENSNQLAERRAQKLLDVAANESQRKHEEYLQKLAEEHSEEVESLMQQVAVWRHQVEVLTEAEKRNYAALVSNGVNPPKDLPDDISMTIPTKVLPSGARIPIIGFGAYLENDVSNSYNIVLSALKQGYRHIDTAQLYHNEAEVG
ncbi:NADP-dependent oxidoreductase domain [Phytophthora cactorum]|nr:NADP-dependent oxidoreductase domain [Phytophthora cactorum]